MATQANPTSTWWKRTLAKLGLTTPLGRRGEKYAARYLQKQGFRIIARNRMLGSTLARGISGTKGEIDLIGIDGQFLVFIEVRTRATDAFMTPEESIRHKKRKVVIRSVRRLIRKHNVPGLTPRIDVVAIIWPAGSKEPSEVRHHRGAMVLSNW